MKKQYNLGALVTTCTNHPADKFIEMVLTKHGWRCPHIWHNIGKLIKQDK